MVQYRRGSAVLLRVDHPTMVLEVSGAATSDDERLKYSNFKHERQHRCHELALESSQPQGLQQRCIS
jgi:hypothetical protein